MESGTDLLLLLLLPSVQNYFYGDHFSLGRVTPSPSQKVSQRTFGDCISGLWSEIFCRPGNALWSPNQRCQSTERKWYGWSRVYWRIIIELPSASRTLVPRGLLCLTETEAFYKQFTARFWNNFVVHFCVISIPHFCTGTGNWH